MTAPRSSAPGRLTTAMRAMTEPVTRRLLVVDDEESIRSALARFLRARGYDVTTADSGAAALDALSQDSFVAVLSDIRMPEMTGLELVPQALKGDPDLAIVMLTAVNDAPTATEALGLGAMDYLMKPVELGDLAAALERALHKRALAIEQRKVERLIREEVAAQTEELRVERELLNSMVLDTVTALVRAQETKDAFLRGHSDRVADLAASMASTLGLSDDEVEAIRLAGRVMDVGKIGLRESVMNKPGALTPEEFDHVKTHVELSLEILSPIKPLAHVLPAVAHHHEHFDGNGYPEQLSGEDISLGGRILAAADAFDALVSPRAWRAGMKPAEAVKFLGERAGTMLDPKVFEALRANVQGRKTLQFLDSATD
ncbi:MAG: response regulator [Gemmatimonadaceae bacterium]|nr:response regulator [Gemmatimonadaceae bacterium]